MSLSIDPSLRGLDDCGCCAGVAAETPAQLANRPGLAAITYRVGTHAAFLHSMLSSLSATENAHLRALATREGDDFSVALLDAWATSLDVLSFYQERIANESYLRTAAERLSLLQLARLIGYELRPGVAASTTLAFTLDNTPGAPRQVTVDAGVKAQSIPGKDEQAQIFETVEQIEARPAWNAIRPRLTTPQTLAPGMSTLWLQGADVNLKTGDALLVVSPQGSAYTRELRRIAAVDKDETARRTRVALEAAAFAPSNSTADTAGVWALRVKAAPFGHNAPLRPDPTTPGDLSKATEWDLDEPDPKRITLDAVYDQIRGGSWVVVDRPNTIWIASELFLGGIGRIGGIGGISFTPRRQIFCHATGVRTHSRAAYGITGRATELTLDEDWLSFDWELSVARDSVVYTQSEALALAEAPLTTPVQDDTIELDGAYGELQKGRAIVVSGQIEGSAADSAPAAEVAMIDGTTTAGGRTTLALKRPLQRSYRRATVGINANAARATHGESATEVLGGGDGSRPFQRFSLRRAPLTYVAATNPAGAETTLEVRVNDVRWHETPTLFGARPNDHVYITRRDDDGKTTVEFGDGRSGARLPTGSDNVRAAYRSGVGTAGNVKAGQISLLMTRPLGVKDVINPEQATGGVDAEARDDARSNAPLTVLTLDRIVSLRDYEDFARAFGGISKALATWTWDGQTRGVFVTVAGAGGAPLAEGSPTFTNLVAAMQAQSDPYVPLRVRSYLAKTFVVEAVVTKDADYAADRVERDARHALASRFSFAARTFGQPVALSEVMAAIQQAPGVAGVDVNVLRRGDGIGGDGLVRPLPAAAPQPGANMQTFPAELLTLDEASSTLTVQ